MSTRTEAMGQETASSEAPGVSIVIPTLNEAGNIAATVERLRAELDAAECADYEVIIVDDDSPDGTGAIANRIAEGSRGRVRVLHRKGPRSLGQSVVEGWALARGEILVLMDADLQHPPEIIPKLIREVESGADIAVGSRYVPGGTIGEFGALRRWLSAAATAAVRGTGGMARVRDPLSGCFAMRRSVIAGRNVRPTGFKVLVEVLRVGQYRHVREVGLRFGRRHAGSSQMRTAMVTEDARLLARMAWADAQAQAERVPYALAAALMSVMGVLLLVTAVRLWTCWHTDALMDHVSGIWLAAADDLRHGALYRPPYSDLGYGGTRYFPLFTFLLAGVWRAVTSWRIAAYSLALGTVALLLGGVYAVLRRLGAGRLIALCGAAAVLAGINTQDALLWIRPDALAAALNLWGVTLCLNFPTLSLEKRERQGWGNPDRAVTGRLLAAAVLFALAFATKMTEVFGVAAVVAAMALAGERRRALKLAGATAAGYAAVLLATIAFAGPAFLDNLRLGASAGATSQYLLHAPGRLFDLLQQSTGEELFFLAACGCLIASRRRLASLPSLLFVVTLLGTLVILGSPGTNRNHLIDLGAASVIAALAFLRANPRRTAAGMTVFAMMLGVATSAAYVAHRYQDGTDNRALRARAMLAVQPVTGPILSENPLFPLMAGQRPYVLDPFMVQVIDASHPHFADGLRRDLTVRRFSAVVLEHDPRTDPQHWFERTHFGPWFVPLLEANYEPVAHPGYIVVYKPKQ